MRWAYRAWGGWEGGCWGGGEGFMFGGWGVKQIHMAFLFIVLHAHNVNKHTKHILDRYDVTVETTISHHFWQQIQQHAPSTPAPRRSRAAKPPRVPSYHYQ